MPPHMWRPSRWAVTSGISVRAPVRRMPPRHVAASSTSPSAQTPGVSAWVSAGQITASLTVRNSVDHPPSGRGSEIIRKFPHHARIRNGPQDHPRALLYQRGGFVATDGRSRPSLAPVPRPVPQNGPRCGSGVFRGRPDQSGAVPARTRCARTSPGTSAISCRLARMAAGPAPALSHSSISLRSCAGRPPSGNRLIDCS